MGFSKPELFVPTEEDMKRVANLVAKNLSKNVNVVLPKEKVQGKKNIKL